MQARDDKMLEEYNHFWRQPLINFQTRIIENEDFNAAIELYRRLRSGRKEDLAQLDQLIIGLEDENNTDYEYLVLGIYASIKTNELFDELGEMCPSVDEIIAAGYYFNHQEKIDNLYRKIDKELFLAQQHLSKVNLAKIPRAAIFLAQLAIIRNDHVNAKQYLEPLVEKDDAYAMWCLQPLEKVEAERNKLIAKAATLGDPNAQCVVFVESFICKPFTRERLPYLIELSETYGKKAIQAGTFYSISRYACFFEQVTQDKLIPKEYKKRPDFLIKCFLDFSINEERDNFTGELINHTSNLLAMDPNNPASICYAAMLSIDFVPQFHQLLLKDPEVLEKYLSEYPKELIYSRLPIATKKIMQDHEQEIDETLKTKTPLPKPICNIVKKISPLSNGLFSHPEYKFQKEEQRKRDKVEAASKRACAEWKFWIG